MLTLEDALARLLAHARPTAGEVVGLADANGRVLADPVVIARNDVPPFDNSAMDGWAARAADLPGRLRVAGEVAAGAGAATPVEPGTAVRIMTGAPVPPGADTVVPLEEAIEAGAVVELPAAAPGRYVRRAGGDTSAGAAVRVDGPLSATQLAVLATLGVGDVEVRRRPVVAILSTGDELVAPGAALGPGQIHDANTVGLGAAARDAGAVPLVRDRIADDGDAVQAALDGAAAEADLVVTSGGVSVGRHDHVRRVLEAGSGVDFWRVAVQPGKPLLVAEHRGTTVIGLPGNPVSALVTFELFGRPFVRALLGLAGDGRPHPCVTMTDAVAKDPERRAFLRVRVGPDLVARSAGGQGSAQVRPLAEANALLIVPEGAAATVAGERYEAILTGAIG